MHGPAAYCGEDLWSFCAIRAQFLSDYVPFASSNWHTCVSCNTGLSTFTSVKYSYTTTLLLLTSVCCVYSNVYSLGDIHCIRYLTTVDPILTHTSSSVQKYHHITSCYVEVPLFITARNPRSIGEVPVPYGLHSIRRLATSSLVSQAEQGIITFNVLQGHDTVVLVCCTSE